MEIEKLGESLQLVSFEQALELKDVGFNWFCERYYHVDGGWLDDDGDKYAYNWNTTNNEDLSERLFDGDEVVNVCSAPPVDLVFRWFYQVHEIHPVVHMYFDTKTGAEFFGAFQDINSTEKRTHHYTNKNYKDKDEAALELVSRIISYMQSKLN